MLIINVKIRKSFFSARVVTGVLISWLLSCLSPLNAKNTISIEPQLHLSNYSINDGLSLNSVTAFAESKDGFIWIGTEDGLNRFDGYEFQTFKRKIGYPNSLVDSKINVLMVGSKGNLWIGTEKGLVIRDIDGNFLPVQTRSINARGSISAIVEDIYFQIWVIQDGMLFLYKEEQNELVPYHHVVQVKSDSINESIRGLFSHGSTLYYGNKDCLFSVDLINLTEEKRCFDLLSGNTANNSITSIHSKDQDTLWVGSSQGVFAINLLSGRTSHYHVDSTGLEKISDNSVQDIYVDSTNRVWVATGNGLNLYNAATNSFTIYRQNLINKYGLLSNDITKVYEDSNGLIWIGTYDAGFHIWNPQTQVFRHYLTRSNASDFKTSNTVHSVTSDLLGNIWIGTYGGGVFRVNADRSKLTHIQSSNPDVDLTRQFVTSLHFDIYDNLWIGTFEGLFIYNPDTSSALLVKDKNLSGYITYISEDHNGDLWVAQGPGLIKVKDIDGEFYREKSLTTEIFTERLESIVGDDDYYINSIYEDVDGIIWIGTDRGLVAFEPNGDKQHIFLTDENNSKSISNNYVQMIYEDTHGVLWIGTGDGLNKLRVDKNSLAKSYFVRFTEDDGLISDSIYGIQSGTNDALWLSSSFGLLMFQTSDNEVSHFNVKDGLQSNEFNIWASHKSSEGEVMFGGVNGVTTFYPEQLENTDTKPPLKLIDVSINNQKHYISPDVTPYIILDERSDYLSIKVAAINFHDAEGQHYRYRLSGLNDEWINLADARIINLFGLESGKYTLEVQSRQQNGFWGEQKLTITLDVKANIWDSKWAFLVYLFIVLSLVGTVLFIWLRRVKLKGQRIKQELDGNRNYIKELRMELESEKNKNEINEQEIYTLKEKAIFYDRKIKEFNKKDKLTNFYLKRYFEAIINNEDAFFRSNQMEFPEGSLIAVSIANHEQLLSLEFKANVEAAISDFSELIQEYVTGDDLISRWDESSFIMLESGSTQENMKKLFDFYQLINNRSFDCGNGRLLKLEFIVTQIPTPFSPHKTNFLNRTVLAYLSADLIGHLHRQGKLGVYLFECRKNSHPTELNKKISQGVEYLIEAGYFELTDLSQYFTREKS
ncbi:ligand-binding sensor domain-containing protein [Pleionea sediminis]|uniref:ligand-binding sensor domain-containing protein n=1 Tax=Pleionea sediminis TaxID=2569479 RepID=UPI00118624E7|nr:two-component regulator propeller domain-containing protein [Pleionea sediminis]